MSTTYEIFCERCGTRHVEEPQPAPLGARLRGIIRNAQPATTARGRAGKDVEPQPFLRVCLACRGYACAACWNEQSGYCLDCAPVEDQIAEPAADNRASPGQFVASATPSVSEWPAADLADLWGRPQPGASADQPLPASADFAPAVESWSTDDAVAFEPFGLLEASLGPDVLADQPAFEAPADLPEAAAATPEFAGEAAQADDVSVADDDEAAADVPESDLLSDGPHVPDLPLFELSAILAQFSADNSQLSVAPETVEAQVDVEPEIEMVAAVEVEPEIEMVAAVEPEQPVEMIAAELESQVEVLAEVEVEQPVEMIAAVQAEPEIELVAVVEPDPPVEMIVAVEPEPQIELLQPVEVPVEVEVEPEMVAAVEPQPQVEVLAEAEVEPVVEVQAEADVEPHATPIPMPAPPLADVIWPPAGPPSLPSAPESVPAIQPMLAFQPTAARRRPANPSVFAARRPVPRNLALVTAAVPQIRDCDNCQLPISVRAHFCRRCGTSQVSA